jgi:hypothetical protein
MCIRDRLLRAIVIGVFAVFAGMFIAGKAEAAPCHAQNVGQVNYAPQRQNGDSPRNQIRSSRRHDRSIISRIKQAQYRQNTSPCNGIQCDSTKPCDQSGCCNQNGTPCTGTNCVSCGSCNNSSCPTCVGGNCNSGNCGYQSNCPSGNCGLNPISFGGCNSGCSR